MSRTREEELRRDMENAQARVRNLRVRVDLRHAEFVEAEEDLEQAVALEDKLRRDWTAASLDEAWD